MFWSAQRDWIRPVLLLMKKEGSLPLWHPKRTCWESCDLLDKNYKKEKTGPGWLKKLAGFYALLALRKCDTAVTQYPDNGMVSRECLNAFHAGCACCTAEG